MALIKCGECGKQVSDKAASCPHCGAPVVVPTTNAQQPSEGIRVLKWIGGLLLLAVVIRACGGDEPTATSSNPQAMTSTDEPATVGFSEATLRQWAADVVNDEAPAARRESYANSILKHFPDTPEAAKAQELLPKLTALAEEARSNGAWRYENSEDAMSGKRVGHARLRSNNAIQLAFPYQGAQRGTLSVRHHPRWGNGVIFSIEQGQLMCHMDDCPVRIRFDEGQPITYQGNEPADNSTETVFLPYAIAGKLKTAKRVRIEMNIYQNGSQVFDFNTKGFDAGKMKPSSKNG